jgi:hypothetical protein
MKFAFVADSQRYDIQTVYPIWSTNLVLYLPMDLHLLWMINVYTLSSFPIALQPSSTLSNATEKRRLTVSEPPAYYIWHCCYLRQAQQLER